MWSEGLATVLDSWGWNSRNVPAIKCQNFLKVPHEVAKLFSFEKGCVSGGKQTVSNFLSKN